jgi:murein peptide amidase A
VGPRHVSALVAAALTAVLAVTVGPPAGAVTRATSEVVTTREVVGHSVEGRPIVAIHRAVPGATRTVLIIGCIHGNEQAGMRVVRMLRDRANLPADVDLWLVPTVNPDGVAADRRTNAHGVDLNRNFTYHWRPTSKGLTWSGPRPLSEPESVALRALQERLNPVLTLVFHQPLFGVGSTDKSTSTVRALARGMHLPVADLNCSGVCTGTFTSWINARTAGLGITVEFGHRVPQWRIGAAAGTILRVGSLVF